MEKQDLMENICESLHLLEDNTARLIVVGNPDTVLKIWKKKNKLLKTKYKKITIFRDQTPRQIDFLTHIRI